MPHQPRGHRCRRRRSELWGVQLPTSNSHLPDIELNRYDEDDLGVGRWRLEVACEDWRRSRAAYASAAARDPRIQPMTMPINRTAGMKMKCDAGIRRVHFS